MEIKELGYEEVKYENLNVGDCFTCQMANTVYMKLPLTLDTFKMPINQAVNLKNGCVANFKNLKLVIPVDAKLEIRKRYKDFNKDSVIIKERIV